VEFQKDLMALVTDHQFTMSDDQEPSREDFVSSVNNLINEKHRLNEMQIVADSYERVREGAELILSKHSGAEIVDPLRLQLNKV
jgi:hypothetical protein